MFDDLDRLDDPSGVPGGDIDRVLHRAGRLRRNRYAVAGSAVALALVAFAVRLPSDQKHSLRPVAGPTADPTPPSESPSPSATTEPTAPPATAPATASANVGTPPPPVASPSDDPGGFPWDKPDGKPGWSDGFTGCSPSPEGAGDDAPGSGLRFTVALDDTTASGYDATGVATVRNEGKTDVHFWASSSRGLDALVYDAAGRPLSGIYWTDAISTMEYDLAPGESKSYDFRAALRSCGDTSSQDRPIPPGEYTVTATLSWYQPGADARAHWWVGTHVPLTVGARRSPRPCGPDEWGRCDPLPLHDDSCDRGAATGGDYGTARHLRISVTADAGTVRSGDPAALTATITNDGATDLDVPYYTGLDAGALRDGAGAHAARREAASAWSAVLVRAGGSATVPLRALTRTCVNGDLGPGVAPGQYTVRAGLYVVHYGWWLPGTDVSLLVTP